jgi:hypothetical protein
MAFTMTIGGSSRSWAKGTLQISDELNSRNTCSFTLLDGGDQFNGIENKAIDGNFTTMNNWIPAYGSGSIASNVYSLTGDGSQTVPRLYQIKSYSSSIEGKKFYVRATVRVTNSSCLNLALTLCDGLTPYRESVVAEEIDNPTINVWYELSGIVTIPNAWNTNDVIIYPYHCYGSAGDATGKVMQIKEVSLFDLTEKFGAGKEPPVNDVNALMNAIGWFDGAYTRDLMFNIGSEVIITKDTIKIFAGNIYEFDETKFGSIGVEYSISCVDYNQLLDRFFVAEAYENQTADVIIKAIIDTFVSGEGLTYANVQVAPIVSKAVFSYQKISDCITELADLLGYAWYLDYDKDLHFVSRESNSAPIYLSDNSLNFRDLSIKSTMADYRNSQYVRAGNDITSARTEILKGDGAKKSFTLKYPVAKVPSVASVVYSDLTNIVTNGSFESALSTGWAVTLNATIQSTTKKYGSSAVEVVASTSRAYCACARDGVFFVPNANSKYYMCAFGYLKSYTSGTLNITIRAATEGTASTTNYDTTKLNQWQKVSLIWDSTGATLTNVDYFCLRDNGIATGVFDIVVDGVVLINLTAKYGPGNEPTQVQMDDLFDDYFATFPTVAKTIGIQGVEENKDYYWNKGAKEITQDDSSASLTSADTLSITYQGLFPIIVEASSDNEIAERKAIEGGSGIYEEVIEAMELDTQESALEYAESILRKKGKIAKIVTFETDIDGLRAGQLIDINIVLHNLSGQYLISQVDKQDLSSATMRYKVTALSGEYLGGWVSFFKQLVKKDQTFVIRENEVLIRLRKFSENVTLTETFKATSAVANSLTNFAVNPYNPSKDIIIFNNELYDVHDYTTNYGILTKATEVDQSWSSASYNGDAGYSICNMIVHSNKLYGVATNSKLFEWNGVDAWVQKAAQYGSHTCAGVSLAIANNKLYALTVAGGLLEWNGTNAWAEKIASNGYSLHNLFSSGLNVFASSGSSSPCVTWDNSASSWSNSSPSGLFIKSSVGFRRVLYGVTDTGCLRPWGSAVVASAPSTNGSNAKLCVLSKSIYMVLRDIPENKVKWYKWSVGDSSWTLLFDKTISASCPQDFLLSDNTRLLLTYDDGKIGVFYP